MTYKKAIILCDLDDTLFQTKRKMIENGITPHLMAALDRELKPRSFMSDAQANLVDWLLSTSEVIPVTARGSDEFDRISIPFDSYKIACHGAMILNPDNQPNVEWQALVNKQMDSLTVSLEALKVKIDEIIDRSTANDEDVIDAWCRINEENDRPIYLVCKVRNSLDEAQLAKLAIQVEQEFGLNEFYIHRNRNNLAFLPKFISKANASKFLLEQLLTCDGRPILGFGDSLSDLPFMALTNFLCIPQQSQISDNKQLMET
jgi:hydroxymethylpyrimidine pyrophosphatase-like HAD family hydrolase